MISLRLIAYRQCFTIGRDSMIIVASHRKPGIDGLRLSATNEQALNSPVFIEDKCSPVARPIGCFKMSGSRINDATVHLDHRVSFARAPPRRYNCGMRLYFT